MKIILQNILYILEINNNGRYPRFFVKLQRVSEFLIVLFQHEIVFYMLASTFLVNNKSVVNIKNLLFYEI